MELNKMASAIINDLWGGNLIPESNRGLISIDQIEDEIIEERSAVIKDWYIHNLLNKHDLVFALNCVDVDCKDQNKCSCKELDSSKKALHFEIPMLMDGMNDDALEFIGSTDRTNSFDVYYNLEAAKYQKYKKRNNQKPYVYIERAPNEHNMCDGWIFNAPFVKNISVIGVFKDPRQLEGYNCCQDTDYLEMGYISNEIKKRILAKKSQLYRTYTPPATQVV